MKSTVNAAIRPRTTSTFLVYLALCHFALPCSTGHAQWQSFERPGEEFRGLTVSDSIVFALTSPSSIHASRDRGLSWSLYERRVPATLEVFALGVLDGRPLEGANRGRYVYGMGFDVPVRQAVEGVEDDIQAIASTKRGTLSTWYLGGFGGGVRRSTDKGKTWAMCNDGLADLNVTSFVTITAPGDTSQVVFAGTYGGGVFRSDDDGLHWAPSNTGLDDLHVNALLATGDTLLAAHSGGRVSRSANAGSAWSTLGTGLPFTDVLSLGQTPSATGWQLFAGTIDKGIWRYAPASGSWKPVNAGIGETRINAIATIDGVVLIGTDRGLYRSTDLGSTWRSADSGAVPFVNAVHAVSMPPGTAATRIFTISDAHYSSIEAYHGGTRVSSRVNRTDDLGTTWTTVPFYPNYLYANSHFTSFATQHDDCILLFSAGSIEADYLRGSLSTDRGTTWGDTRSGPPMLECRLSGLAIRDNPAEQRFEIFLTTAGGPWPGLASSLDSGKTWSPLGLPNNGQIKAPLLSQGSLLYAASDSSALRSSDGGQTWDRITYNGVYPFYTPPGSTGSMPVFALLHANSARLFARVLPAILSGDPGGLYASTDLGATWTPAGFTGLLVDRIIESNGTLFALQNGRVFASRTDTLRWKDISGELTTDSIVVISASPVHLVALTHASDVIWYRPMAEIKDLLAGDPVSVPPTAPLRFALHQNYPNPFNPSTTIGYQIPANSTVNLAVFDLLGREVAVLVNERKEAGSHTATFDATRLASGMYFYRLTAAGRVETRRMTVLR